MGVLDDVFAGQEGLANSLINLFGGEAVFETVVGETYDESRDMTVKDIRRQKLPLVIETVKNSAGASSVPGGEGGGLESSETLYVGSVPSVNLDVDPVPLKTVIRQGNERYQVIDVERTVVGNTPVLFKLTMRKL